jgi:glycosyltransferase involved in cell wall biosynthesis
MKLLISTYACAPHRGSEHAVGWNWTTEAHRQGHEVWALVAPAHRDSIAAACRADPDLAGITWVFPEVPVWPLQQGVEPKRERTYNLLWQISALRHARALHRAVGFDAVHHLTWGGVRAPMFMGALGVPLIVGPMGGGETSPRKLRDGFGLKARITEAVRDISNATITANPIVRGGLAGAAAIFVKTPDTRRLLTRSMQEKSAIFIEIGLLPAQIGTPRPARLSPPRFLFAGRLLYWKGAHIALRAFAGVAHRLPGARLTIVGKGPEEARLKADATALGVQAAVDFIPWLPQQRLFELYGSHDLLVFPSLHDSSGNVVVEAFAHGLPVACLALGGPGVIVTPQSGIAIDTAGRNTDAVAAAMADEIFRVFADPARLPALSQGAIARAREFILSDRVATFYARAAEAIGVATETRKTSAHGDVQQSGSLARSGVA